MSSQSARVGQIEATTPPGAPKAPERAPAPVYAAFTERAPTTAAEHLDVMLRGHKVYDLNRGTTEVVIPKPAPVKSVQPVSSEARRIAAVLKDFPGSSIREVAAYEAASEGVPVRAVVRTDLWRVKQGLLELVTADLAVSRYGENTSRYWLTEQGLTV